jgi:hypothetical protein
VACGRRTRWVRWARRPEESEARKESRGGQLRFGYAARVREEQPGVRHTLQRAGSSTCPGEEWKKEGQQQQRARCDRLNECSRALHRHGPKQFQGRRGDTVGLRQHNKAAGSRRSGRVYDDRKGPLEKRVCSRSES